MPRELLAPMMALCVVISGMVRWDVSGKSESGNRPTVTAAKQGCPWNCLSAAGGSRS